MYLIIVSPNAHLSNYYDWASPIYIFLSEAKNLKLSLAVICHIKSPPAGANLLYHPSVVNGETVGKEVEYASLF